ncbi:MAG TPA: dTDP-4-dehydrorhamnose reductase [Polyangia bacterium]|jgi:dTDP-4-dehydrorhamnose reductase|nr:dTDP-4-dehydrorhamnose reductase [Polyangia bacterium]
MRAIVFGARGTLGQALVAALPRAGYQLAAALDRASCDICDPGAVRAAFERFAPDVAFNAAAYTDVDGAEAEPDRAYAANAIAPETLARAADAAGAALVHYSTDFVYDGERERSYDEFDPPSPQGLYARSKVAGEVLAAAATQRLFVVRVGCLYGRGGRNFPSTILRRLKAGEVVRADRDRLGSPTWVAEVAQVSAALARTPWFGLYHCTSAGETSWAAFAHFLAGELGLPDSRIDALPTSALPMKAPRPRRAILDNRMLRLRGLDTMSSWQEAARGFMKSESEAT